MSYSIAAPEIIFLAATDLAGIGSTLNTANAAAAIPTTRILAAAQDEVSAAIAAQFSTRGQAYQVLSAHAAASHDQFAHALSAGAGGYRRAEAANNSLLNAVNAPTESLLGRPLIGNGATGLREAPWRKQTAVPAGQAGRATPAGTVATVAAPSSSATAVAAATRGQAARRAAPARAAPTGCCPA